MAEATATLDDVITKLDTIITKLTSLNTTMNSVKTATTNAANDVEIIGDPGVKDTGVNNERTFVLSPWPVKSEGE